MTKYLTGQLQRGTACFLSAFQRYSWWRYAWQSRSITIMHFRGLCGGDMHGRASQLTSWPPGSREHGIKEEARAKYSSQRQAPVNYFLQLNSASHLLFLPNNVSINWLSHTLGWSPHDLTALRNVLPDIPRDISTDLLCHYQSTYIEIKLP